MRSITHLLKNHANVRISDSFLVYIINRSLLPSTRDRSLNSICSTIICIHKCMHASIYTHNVCCLIDWSWCCNNVSFRVLGCDNWTDARAWQWLDGGNRISEVHSQKCGTLVFMYAYVKKSTYSKQCMLAHCNWSWRRAVLMPYGQELWNSPWEVTSSTRDLHLSHRLFLVFHLRYGSQGLTSNASACKALLFEPFTIHIATSKT